MGQSNSLADLCRVNARLSSGQPQVWLRGYLELDTQVRAALAASGGIKSSIEMDFSDHAFRRLKACALLSDFTSVYLNSRQTTEMDFMTVPNTSQVYLTVETIRDRRIAIRDGVLQLVPGFGMRGGPEAPHFLTEIFELQESGKLMVRPRPFLIAPDDTAIDEDGNLRHPFDGQVLSADPDAVAHIGFTQIKRQAKIRTR